MTDVEFMMQTFHLSEDDARKAIELGFKATDAQGNRGSELVGKEIGLSERIAEAEKQVSDLQGLVEQPK